MRVDIEKLRNLARVYAQESTVKDNDPALRWFAEVTWFQFSENGYGPDAESARLRALERVASRIERVADALSEVTS